MTYIPYLGTFFFSRYPSVVLARNKYININKRETEKHTRVKTTSQANTNKQRN